MERGREVQKAHGTLKISPTIFQAFLQALFFLHYILMPLDTKELETNCFYFPSFIFIILN